MGIISSVFGFLWGALKKLGGLFASIPSKLAVLGAGLTAVVTEIMAFVDSLVSWFNGVMSSLDDVFRQFALLVADSSLFNMLSYCVAFDTLVTILASVVGVIMTVLTFIFVTFVHVVLIFFGLRFGYRVYKYLVTSFSNGIAKA